MDGDLEDRATGKETKKQPLISWGARGKLPGKLLPITEVKEASDQVTTAPSSCLNAFLTCTPHCFVQVLIQSLIHGGCQAISEL